MGIKDILCEKCNGKNIKKDGVRETKNRGEVQTYKCKDCSHRFSIDDGFWKMKNHEGKITASMKYVLCWNVIKENTRAFTNVCT
ncbi:hypothetical protein HY450_01025 [Candidatus Pacearchaeota archaeon]|nr:hypothetical protein [Candidatus Pacearchaeota archaeon]